MPYNEDIDYSITNRTGDLAIEMSTNNPATLPTKTKQDVLFTQDEEVSKHCIPLELTNKLYTCLPAMKPAGGHFGFCVLQNFHTVQAYFHGSSANKVLCFSD